MQFIKNDKLYDTDTAEVIKMKSEYIHQPYPYVNKEMRHILYQKLNGEFFLLKEEYGKTFRDTWLLNKPTIKPLTEEEAKEWAEDNLSATEYINIFGPISE